MKKYGGIAEKSMSGGMTNADCPFLVKVTAKDLSIRKGAGISTEWMGKAEERSRMDRPGLLPENISEYGLGDAL